MPDLAGRCFAAIFSLFFVISLVPSALAADVNRDCNYDGKGFSTGATHHGQVCFNGTWSSEGSSASIDEVNKELASGLYHCLHTKSTIHCEKNG